MGWFQRLRGGIQPRDKPNEASKVEIAVGAKDDGWSTMTYNDKSITFQRRPRQLRLRQYSSGQAA